MRIALFGNAGAVVVGAVMAAGLLFSPVAFAQNLAEEAVKAAPEDAWRLLDPENTLLMDLPSGRITIEMRPDLAPAHVTQIKTLTRQGFYNGVTFHRVIEGFMAQGGDPTGTGTGDSSLPDIQGEFYKDAHQLSGVKYIGRDSKAARVGFLGPVPVSAQPDTLQDFFVDGSVAAWGSHCPGVMSMARTSDPNSANSQFFLMFGDSRDNLDASYTVWGRIVDGLENSRRISRGEPPVRPTPIVRARIAADLPVSDRDKVEVMRTDSQAFVDYVKLTGKMTDDGYVEDLCGIRIPARINGEVKF